ncbi:MAG TPA: hypothetical protein VFB32_13285 [Rudaea sp.]|nr:hypothetical protein [Rudaea sp.]
MEPGASARARWDLALAAGVLVAVVGVYWPVAHAGFVWDDKSAFHDVAWLRYGDAWWGFLLHGLNGWINYFRPLVIALFTAEVRAFDVAPGPMHLVSLVLHLADTVLVGLLAQRLAALHGRTPRRYTAAAAMLVYGMHPALVEPVVWISCQFELVATLFVLLALYCNLAIASPLRRAAAVAGCFLLAACAKESAAALPLLLLIVDFVADYDDAGLAPTLRRISRNRRGVYAAVLLAGLAYLAARYAALGHLLAPAGGAPLPGFARLQKICYAYANYWRIAVLPIGAGPLHVVDDAAFSAIAPRLFAADLASVAIAALGIVGLRKGQAWGAAILAFSAALLPVLHIVPVDFVESVYHERYVMLALGVGCAWLPAAIGGFGARVPLARVVGGVLALAWLVFAVADIRVTVPLWSDELALWQWALREDPDSIIAKDHLLTEYMSRGDEADARALATALVRAGTDCPNCMLNAAYVELMAGDLALASQALDRLKSSAAITYDPRLLHGYILASGELRAVQNDFAGAEDAYRDAIATDAYDPMPYTELALLLAKQARYAEARAAADKALALFAPDERARRSKVFDALIPRDAERSARP